MLYDLQEIVILLGSFIDVVFILCWCDRLLCFNILKHSGFSFYGNILSSSTAINTLESSIGIDGPGSPHYEYTLM